MTIQKAANSEVDHDVFHVEILKGCGLLAAAQQKRRTEPVARVQDHATKNQQVGDDDTCLPYTLYTIIIHYTPVG